MNDTLQTLIRLVVKMLAGFLVGHGLITQSAGDQLTQTAAGVLLGLIGLVLSRYHQRQIAAKGGTTFFTKQPGSPPSAPIPRSGSILLLMAALWVASPGCSTTPTTVAYRATASVKATVDTAMKAFADADAQGRVTPAQEATARKLYQAYVEAVARARSIIAASTAAQLNNNLDAAVAEISAASTAVVTFANTLK